MNPKTDDQNSSQSTNDEQQVIQPEAAQAEQNPTQINVNAVDEQNKTEPSSDSAQAPAVDVPAEPTQSTEASALDVTSPEQPTGERQPASSDTATPVSPSATNPAQPQGNDTTAQVSGIPTMQPKSAKKSHKKLLFMALPILVLVTVVGVFLGMQVFGNSVTLVKYSNDDFSIQYPEGYEQKEEQGLIYFQEQLGETDATGEELEKLEKTRSGVIVGTATIPTNLSAEQKGLLQEQFRKVGDNFADVITSDNQEVKNKNTDNNYKIVGIDGSYTSAEIYENNSKVADVAIAVAINDDRMIVIAVLSHVDDSGVADNAKKIVESFKLAEQ